MATTGTLHHAFIEELRDAYDAERQLVKALPKMAKAASSSELRKAFESHLAETQGQVSRLAQPAPPLTTREPRCRQTLEKARIAPSSPRITSTLSPR